MNGVSSKINQSKIDGFGPLAFFHRIFLQDSHEMLFSRAAKARLLLGARVIQPAIRMEIANLHAEKKLPYTPRKSYTPQEELCIVARRRSRTLGAGRWLRWTSIFFQCTERGASVLRMVAAISTCNAMRRGSARAVIQRSGAPLLSLIHI